MSDVKDPALKKYDPEEVQTYETSANKKLYGALGRIILTEFKTSDKDGVLTFRPGQKIALSNDMIRKLLHAESGPRIPRDLLTVWVDPKIEEDRVAKAKAKAEAEAKAKAEADSKKTSK